VDTTLLITIALAIAPGIAIAIFIYFRDKYEKEPFKLLLGCFLFGLLSLVPAFILEFTEGLVGFSEQGNLLQVFIYALLGVGLVEEMSKYFFLRVYAYPKAAFNEPFDGIVYAVMIAMGFATGENVMYAITHGFNTAVMRMFTAVPLHATCGIIMGFYVGLSKFRKYSVLYIVVGLVLAILLHGAYDFFLFQQDYPALALMAFVSLAIAVAMSFIAIRRLQKCSPFRTTLFNYKDRNGEGDGS
jgi:RsiW-degrading membrane proteinase PrsW (M82 family)